MKLSERSEALVSHAIGIVKGHLRCQENPFSPTNPDGYINFGTAENELMEHFMSEKLSENSSIDPALLHYNKLSGMDQLKNSFAAFAKKYLEINLIAENIVVQNGLSSICESLCYCLLNPGDKIFIFAPYYSGFDYDFSRRFQGEIVPVDLSPEDQYYHHISNLDDAFSQHPEGKALLICHPHNPTGRILSSDEIANIIAWCEERDIHLIVDEIYALSMIKPVKPFQSFLHHDFEPYKNLHYIYGMAKDFGMGGFKVGFFHTRNEELLKRMQAISYFHCVSTYTQLAVSRLLEDTKFLDFYIKENQHSLKKAFAKLHADFPYFQEPEAGLYCYTKINEDELNTFEKLLDEYRINMLPGTFFHDPSSGYFRICFAKSDAALDEFIVRFKRFSET